MVEHFHGKEGVAGSSPAPGSRPAAGARGRGLSAALLSAALDRTRGRVRVLDAQSHLVGFYARHGFAPAGEQYVEDGIPHTPMRRDG